MNENVEGLALDVAVNSLSGFTAVDRLQTIAGLCYNRYNAGWHKDVFRLVYRFIGGMRRTPGERP